VTSLQGLVLTNTVFSNIYILAKRVSYQGNRDLSFNIFNIYFIIFQFIFARRLKLWLVSPLQKLAKRVKFFYIYRSNFFIKMTQVTYFSCK